MSDDQFKVGRILWLAPLTILSSIGAVLATRRIALLFVTPPARFAPLLTRVA